MTVKAIRTGPGHECRGRNRQVGAKLSAHAQGLALDVAGFDFADGRSLQVAGSAQDAGFVAARATACTCSQPFLGQVPIASTATISISTSSPTADMPLPDVSVNQK